jgi:hypothetical protein
MTDPIHAEDGSPLREEAQTERAFNHPMSAHGTDPESEVEETIDPRMAMIESLADQANEERMAPEGAVLTGLAPEVPEGYTPEENVIVDPIEPDSEGLPAEYADDPLAKFIVMDGDNPMFKTTYEGEETLIPLEKAQREMQKHVAADIRLRQNTEWQRTLEAREAQLRQNTVALAENLRTRQESPPSTPAVDVDDKSLEAEAREVVSGLFTGTEDEAAAKLADLLKKNRGPTTPAVDTNQIVQQAVQATRQQISAEAKDADVKSGFKQFSSDYPEIMADENLFGYADSMTTDIAAENPNWMPSEVMLEAGKRVREWVQSMKAPEPAPEAQQNNDRLERKQQLRPLPRIRQGTQESAPIEQPQTPSQMMEEIRAARGQIA